MKSMKSTVKRMDEEEMFKIMGDKSPVGVCIIQDGKFCYLNSNFPLAIGYTADELVDKDPLELIVPEDREMARENEIKMLKGELMPPYQFRVIHKDGSIRWVMETVRSVQYHGRRAVLGNYMEVTERKQAEDALKESGEKYRELANSITDVFFAMDEHLRYTYWNKASEILTGIRTEDAIGKSLREIFPDTPGVRKAEKVYRNVLKTQQPQTFVNDMDIDGRHYIFEISAYPSLGGISVFVNDITERKQAEEQLKESEQKYRLLFETSLDCIAQIDREGRILAANPAAARSLGVPLGELIGKTFFEVMPQEVAQLRLENVRKVLDEWQPQIFEDERAGRYFHHIFIPMKTLDRKEAVQGITRDITERRKMEEALRHSEEKYRALFDSTAIGKFVMDAETMKVIMANQAAAKMLGFSSVEEAIGLNVFDFIFPDDREKAFKLTMEDMFEQDLRQTHEIRAVTKDGRTIWISATGARIMHEGRLAGLISFTNITERKQTEEALRRSEERYRTTLEEMEDSYFEVDLGGHLTFVNNSVCRDLGYSRKELIGMSYKGFIAEDDMESVFRVFNEVYRTGVLNKGFSWKTIRKDGSYGFAETSVSLLRNDKGEIIGFRGVGRDVTERKQAEEALRQSEENYRALFDSSVIGTVLLDAETMKVVMVNQAALKMFGFSSAEEAFGAKPFDFILPEDKEKYLEITKTAVFEQNSHEGYQLRAVAKDGREIWINTTATMITHRGKLAALISFTDITARKQVEEALRQSEEKHRTMLEEMEDSYFEVDLGGHFTFVNNAVCRHLGYTREELIGMSYKGFTTEEDIESVFRIFNEVYRTDEPNKSFNWQVIRKDGVQGFVEALVSPLRNDKGEIIGFRGVGRDISERRQMEEQLIVADRLVSIGELASGIAHELNNPLTGIIGFSQLLAERNVPEEIKEDLKLINSEAQRAANVVKGLLTFARKHPSVRQLSNINDVIGKVLELRAYEQKVSNIETVINLAPDLPKIGADFFQLQQVFLNIVTNAEYFMLKAHNKGTLTITTGRLEDIVRISFTDDGPGISGKDLGHVFDPFFTTKEVGQGTGLGLSISHGIVTAHGGRIYAESKQGKGATFVVELPIGQEEGSYEKSH